MQYAAMKLGIVSLLCFSTFYFVFQATLATLKGTVL